MEGDAGASRLNPPPTRAGLSRSLRALEQSFGRDPEAMIPDVRFTPNPNVCRPNVKPCATAKGALRRLGLWRIILPA